MKRYLFALFILIFLVLPFVNAERVNLKERESYMNDGRNVTLLAIDNKRDKVLVCVNDEKVIISKDRPKTINEVSLSLKSISDYLIRVDINVYCKKCRCDESCLNLKCFDTKKTEEEQIEEQIRIEETQEKIFLQNENVEVVENPGLGTSNISLALAIIVVFSVILYYLIKLR